MQRARAMAALGGLALLGSLWLPWYTANGDSGTAWQTFSGLDYTLAVLAISARTLYPPNGASADLDPSFGPFVGLAGAVLVLTSLSAARQEWQA